MRLCATSPSSAALLGGGLSTWKRFKAGDAVPATIARLCRAAQRAPVIGEACRERHAT